MQLIQCPTELGTTSNAATDYCSSKISARNRITCQRTCRSGVLACRPSYLCFHLTLAPTCAADLSITRTAVATSLRSHITPRDRHRTHRDKACLTVPLRDTGTAILTHLLQLCLYPVCFKTRRFGDRILSPPSGNIY
jgi:hypothetical protein